MDLEKRAREIATRNNFDIGDLIYKGTYYDPGKVRNLVFSGKYQGQPAMIKFYNDPRLTDEPRALEAFNKSNRSKLLVAPRVYLSEITSPTSGWLIMEALSGGAFLKSPLDAAGRKSFLELFLEYKNNFPTEPHRPLTLAEKLPANKNHLFKISRWLELADKKQAALAEGQEELLSDEFLDLYKQGTAIIDREFSDRKMTWCHGHFKPKEIYALEDRSQYYLTDFAHVRMYPEGYELAFIVWADYMMTADWQLDYKQWRQGIWNWIDDLRPVADKLGVEKFDKLIKASLIERILGSILADVAASDRPIPEKKKRIELLSELFREFV